MKIKHERKQTEQQRVDGEREREDKEKTKRRQEDTHEDNLREDKKTRGEEESIGY